MCYSPLRVHGDDLYDLWKPKHLSLPIPPLPPSSLHPSPIYVSEISPAHARGSLITLNEVAMTLGASPPPPPILFSSFWHAKGSTNKQRYTCQTRHTQQACMHTHVHTHTSFTNGHERTVANTCGQTHNLIAPIAPK